MTSRDFDYLTLRNLQAYNTNGSYVSTGYILAVGPKGKGYWTNALSTLTISSMSTVTVSTLSTFLTLATSSFTANTASICTLNASSITGFSTITVSTISTNSGYFSTLISNDASFSTVTVSSVSSLLLSSNVGYFSTLVTGNASFSTVTVSSVSSLLLSSNVGYISTLSVTNLTGPAATNWSDYLYWDTTVTPNSWQVDGDKVHLGSNAGSTSQGNFSVAVGSQAGQSSQGNNSVAVGYRAGLTNQHASTLILNASGSALNSATQNACYIAPIRLASTTNVLYYNSITKEVVYGAAPSGGNTSTMCISTIGIGTMSVSTIQGCVTIVSQQVYDTPGSYTVSIPCGINTLEFEMIGAGGGNNGNTGGYLKGTITLPTNTNSIKVVVGGAGDVVQPSNASYINIPGITLFAMAGAGGANVGGGGFGGVGGGGLGSFVGGVAPGTNGIPSFSGTGGQGGQVSGGGAGGTNCSGTASPTGIAGGSNTGNYEQASGGNGDSSIGFNVAAGGSGYTGGGSGCGGGGGSSYYNASNTVLIASYDGSGVTTELPGFGRSNQGGKVVIRFNPSCNDVSLRTTGDIVTRNVFTSSVQIGITGSPAAFPFEINQLGTSSTFTAGYLYNSSGIQSSITTGTINMRSVSGIWAANFYASSDQRIKTNIKDINDDQALQVVRGLQPVCYNYIDPIRHHNQLEYGFIAQQVKSLLPHAVRTETEFVPNIYDLADFSALGSEATMVTLRRRTIEHIQVNDVVKILDLKEKPLIYSVTDVNYNYFTIDVNLSTIVSEYELTEEDVTNGIQKNTVFVYGTRVDDFHVLDKHAIYSVSIGALQEMDRTIQRQALRILDLETRQEARLKDLEDKLGVLTMEKPL